MFRNSSSKKPTIAAQVNQQIDLGMALEAKGDLESLEQAYIAYKEGLKINPDSMACKAHLSDVLIQLYDKGIEKPEAAILRKHRESLKNK